MILLYYYCYFLQQASPSQVDDGFPSAVPDWPRGAAASGEDYRARYPGSNLNENGASNPRDRNSLWAYALPAFSVRISVFSSLG